jgi:hypothetical protein
MKGSLKESVEKLSNLIRSFSLLGVLLYLAPVNLISGDINQRLSPLVKSLNPIEITEETSGIEGVDCIYIINLNERPEKWNRIKANFDEQHLKINRVSAINGWKIPQWKRLQLSGGNVVRLSGGEIGCFLSHLSIYKDALDRGFNAVWICEDDVEFIEDANEIAFLIKELNTFDPSWDIFYTDYCVHGTGCQDPRPDQPLYEVLHNVLSKDLVRMHGRHRLHSVIFSKQGLQKVLDYFSHKYLWSALDVDIHYVPGLREYSSTRDIATSVKEGIISDTPIGSSLNPQK